MKDLTLFFMPFKWQFLWGVDEVNHSAYIIGPFGVYWGDNS